MKQRPLGFTLLDLLTGLAILSILIGAAIPGLNTFVANNKANAAYQQLFTLLQYARSESVFYRQQVVICPTINDQDCDKDWKNELILFVDENRNKKYDDSDILLQRYEETENNSQRIVTAFGSTRYLSFNYDGSSGSQNGRLTYCLASGKQTYARQMIISKTGRIRKTSEQDALKKC